MSELTLFDLDQTLIAQDTDYEWMLFLIDKGIIPNSEYETKLDDYMAQYHAGTLDIFDYLTFQLHPFSLFPQDQLRKWRTEFVETRIAPHFRKKTIELVRKRLQNSTYTAIITATNDFLASQIAQKLGVPHVIGTQLEENGDRFTGRVQGIPCFQAGKIARLEEWLLSLNIKWEDFSHTRFYSDSQNDIPLLNKVHEPIAVDPDPVLLKHAQEKGWAVISLAD